MIPSTDWHFARPDLADKYLQMFQLGLTSARGLFARRRMGKTEFLLKDFIPAAKNRGYSVVYVNLWNAKKDPATALMVEFYKSIEPKGFENFLRRFITPVSAIKASGKITGVVEGGIETHFQTAKKLVGSLLTEAMQAFDKHTTSMILVIDEAQVLAYEANSDFAHALRAALDVRKDRIKVIFAGSSEGTLRKMFGVASEPFYNWAPLEPFDLLGEAFVKAMVAHVNAISQYPLALDDALAAFTQLNHTPEFFRHYVEYYVLNPMAGTVTALENTKTKVFNDQGFFQQWQDLLVADRMILSMIAAGSKDLFSKDTLQYMTDKLGLANTINRNTTQNALRRLMLKNIITKIDHGVYQLEDIAFSDWILHQD